MTNDELIDTLKTASESQDNIALKMLLMMAAERIQTVAEEIYSRGYDEGYDAGHCAAESESAFAARNEE